MSLFDKLFGGLFDLDDDNTQAEHPCSNCPASCTIAPAACPVCQPYKEQMIEAIYRVEHKDEIISQYEVVGTSASTGTVVCPHCGGHSENPYVCDYCGSKLQEGSGKIQVESAKDIPNPVLEAQDLIFSRYEAVRKYAGSDSGYGYEDALSGIGSQGLFSSIFSALMGFDDDSDSKSIGNKMTESEISEMAKYYGVSVSDYLQGLDNGKYLTLSNKSAAARAEQQYSSSHSQSSGMGMGGLAGAAGAAGLASLLFGGTTYNTSAAVKPHSHNQHQGGYPPYMQQGSKPQQKPQQKPQNAQQQKDPKLNNAAASLDMRASQARKEALEKEKREQARREAQERERQKQEKARKEAQAKNSDRLDAGNLTGAGRRQEPASARPQRVPSSQKTASAPGSTKAPGGASGMGRRPDKHA